MANEGMTVEQHMGDNEFKTPCGTPTERLIWVALWHCGSYWGHYTEDSILYRHIGGSHRAIEAAMRSLVRRGIIERKHEDGLWGSRLHFNYSQLRYVKDPPAEPFISADRLAEMTRFLDPKSQAFLSLHFKPKHRGGE